MKKLLSLLLALAMVLTMTAAFAEGAEEAEWGMAEFAAHADIRYELANDYTGKTVILHSNDVHGQVDGYAYIAGLRDYFKSLGAEVILADAGDFSQGTPYFSELDGVLEPRVINDLAYDCITLGNHEFDNDIEALTARLKALRSETRVVCANLDLSGFPLGEIVKPFAIIRRGGMKIGIIGLEADLSTNVTKAVSSRLTQLDNVEVTNRWADYLHNEEKCDLIILLSHIGYEEDQALIPQTRWIDLVVGGHSHTFVDGFVYVADANGKQVPIITDGCWGLEMGQINVK